MATFFEAQKAAFGRMEKMQELAGKLGYDISAGKIRESMDMMKQRQLVVLVAGEVKTGKSSLLNGFLGEKDEICPMNQDVCTNTVTILQYAEEEHIDVYIADDEAPDGIRIETTDRSHISEYASEEGNPANYKNVVQIIANVSNPLLKEGVVFVDTPGVGSLNPAHAEITHSFLPRADVLLFVTDSLTPMSQAEMNFLKRGYDKCETVIFPLTKKDLNADYETIMNGNIKKISGELGIPENEVKVIPVSSMAKLKYLKDVSKERLYRNSNFAELEKAVWTAVAKRQAEVRILPFMLNAETEMRKIADSLLAQLSAANDNASATELRQKLDACEEELKKLKADSAEWQFELKNFFLMEKLSVDSDADTVRDEAVSIVKERKAELGTKICEPENVNKILAEINDVLVSGLNKRFEKTEEDLTNLILQIHDNMKLDMEFAPTLPQNQNAPETIEINLPKKTFMEKLKNQGREMGGNRYALTGIGTTVGALIGGVIGAPGGPGGIAVGASVGSAVGGALANAAATVANIFKLFSSKNKYTAMDVSVTVDKLQSYIGSTYKKMMDDFHKGILHLQNELPKVFKKLIEDRIGEIQKNRNDINEIMKTDMTERAELCKELEKNRRLVCDMIRKSEILHEKISNLKISSDIVLDDDAPEDKKKGEACAEPATYGFM